MANNGLAPLAVKNNRNPIPHTLLKYDQEPKCRPHILIQNANMHRSHVGQQGECNLLVSAHRLNSPRNRFLCTLQQDDIMAFFLHGYLIIL
jgi:hypothetical protein